MCGCGVCVWGCVRSLTPCIPPGKDCKCQQGLFGSLGDSLKSRHPQIYVQALQFTHTHAHTHTQCQSTLSVTLSPCFFFSAMFHFSSLWLLYLSLQHTHTHLSFETLSCALWVFDSGSVVLLAVFVCVCVCVCVFYSPAYNVFSQQLQCRTSVKIFTVSCGLNCSSAHLMRKDFSIKHTPHSMSV